MSIDGSVVRIGTHNGVFHADEVVACVILRHLPEYSKAEIVRTRDEDLLKQCNIVVDVGGLFDPKSHRYDHHQREIDAIDNGVNITDGSKRYTVNTGISSRVGSMNPNWNETGVDEMKRFHEALAMVENELLGIVRHLAHVWYPARDLVRKALVERHQVDPSGAIISLEGNPCPWSSHLLELERVELGKEGSPLHEFTDTDLKEFNGRPIFCLYQRKDTQWGVQGIQRSDLERFSLRLAFPEPWRGLRDARLSEVTGVPQCVFVHAGGFLAINKTREGALQLARITLKLAKVIV